MYDDLYGLLGLDRGATGEEIANAVRTSRRRWMKLQSHPNVSQRQEAELRVLAISSAESTLLDPVRRADYDATLPPIASPGISEPQYQQNPPAGNSDPLPSSEPDEASDQQSPVPSPNHAQRPLAEQITTWIKTHRVSTIVVAGGVIVAMIIAISVTTNGAARQQSSDVNANSGSNAGGAALAPATQASSEPTASVAPPQTLDLSSENPRYLNGALYTNIGGSTPILIPGGAVSVDASNLVDSPQTTSGVSLVEANSTNDPRLVGLLDASTPALDLTPATESMELVFLKSDNTTVQTRITLSTTQGTSYTVNRPGFRAVFFL